MKKIFVIFFFLVSLQSLAVDLKDYVCKVIPDSVVSKAEVSQTSRNLLSQGYYSASKTLLNSFGRGSGFVVASNEDNRYVLTNHHVVGSSKMVSLEFQNADGSFKKYDNCRVLDVSKDIDAALIELPKDYSVKGSLGFLLKVPDETAEVYSAGFPGLGNDQIWQLGKCIVSNSVVVKDGNKMIQHTAQVDPGNSGGPLLVKQGKNYVVVGMNTLKAFNRENTGLSITSSDIAIYLKTYENYGDKTYAPKSLNEAVSDFAKTLSSDTKEASDYISRKNIYSYSQAEFQVLSVTSNDEIANIIKNDDIEKGLKMLVIENLKKTVKKSTILPQGEIRMSGDTALVNYGFNQNKTLFTSWIKESGEYKLLSYSDKEKNLFEDKKENSGNSSIYTPGFHILEDYMSIIELGVGFPLTDTEKNHFSLGYYGGKKYFYYGAYLSYGNYVDPNPFFDFVVNVGVRVPMGIGRFYIAPYVLPAAGMRFGIPDIMRGGFLVAPNAGIQLGVFAKDEISIYIAPEYKYNLLIDGMRSSTKYKQSHILMLKLGVTF